MVIEPQLLKIEEAATALNIGRSKAYELARRGELPGVVRVGSSLRVSRARLVEWIDEQTGNGKAAPVGLSGAASEVRRVGVASLSPS